MSASSGEDSPRRKRWSAAKAIMAALSVVWVPVAGMNVRRARRARSVKTSRSLRLQLTPPLRLMEGALNSRAARRDLETRTSTMAS